MGVPKLRFKADDGSDFPDWTFRTFGSVVEEFNDRTTTENEDVLLSCAIDGMYLNSEFFGHQRGASNIGYKKITKGALILSMQNLHLGNANVNTRFEHGIVSPAYKTFHIVGCLTEFMSAWVKRHAARKFFYDATTVGASQCRRNVDWEELYQQTIAVPSPSEQRKIADLLSAVDDVIAAQEAEVAAWEKRKKGVMQKLFSQEVRFKADDGSDFPDWEKMTLGDVGSVAMCKRVFKEQTREVGDVPFFKIGTFGGVPDAYISKSLFDELKSKYAYPEVGTILLSASGTIGRQVEYKGEDAYYQDSNIVWLKHDDTVLNSYLKQFYSVVKWQGLEGSTIKRLYNKTILDTPFYRPSLPEQRKIADCLALLDDVIAKAKDELDAWRELKKGLLQQMFV